MGPDIIRLASFHISFSDYVTQTHRRFWQLANVNKLNVTHCTQSWMGMLSKIWQCPPFITIVVYLCYVFIREISSPGIMISCEVTGSKLYKESNHAGIIHLLSSYVVCH